MKNSKIIIIILIITSIVFVVLLGYNSIVNLSYTKSEIGNCIFTRPKKIIIEKKDEGEIKIIDKRIVESSMLIVDISFYDAIQISKGYSFYKDEYKIIKEEKEDKYYRIEKAIHHNYNNEITYLSTHLYDLENNTAVITVEYKSEEDKNKLENIIKKIVKSTKKL